MNVTSLNLLPQVKDLYREAKYTEALELIELIEKEDEIDDIVQIEVQILKCRINIADRKSEIDLDDLDEENLRLAESALEKSRKLESKIFELNATIAKAFALRGLNRRDEMFPTIERAEELLTKLTELSPIQGREYEATLFYLKGQAHFGKEDNDLTLKYWEKSLEIYQELNYKNDFAQLYYSIGLIYERMGDLDNAIKSTKKALAILQEIGGNKKEIFWALNNLAYYHEVKGELDQALEWRKNQVAHSQEWDKKSNVAIYHAAALNDLGLIYYYKGELDQALNYYNRSFSLREKFDPHSVCIKCLNNMGLFFYATNEFEKSHESFSKALTFLQDLDNNKAVSKALFRMIQIDLSQKNPHRAQESFNRLETLKRENDHDSINTYYQLANGLILKSSKRLRQKIEAEKIFSTLINKETPLDHEIAIIAIKHLCELLLDELGMYGEVDVLQQVKDLVLRLDNIGKSQHSFSIIVEALILRSKLTLLEGNLEKTRHLLEQAELTACEKGMKFLEFQVQEEKAKFESEFEKWRELIDTNAEMSERIKFTEITEYLKFAQQSMKLK